MIRDKIEDIKRFDEVLKKLVENEMGFLIEKSGLSDQLPFTERLKIKKHERPGPERLRETIEELGSIYVKFGQILAQRPDLIPRRYCKELEKLEDNVPAFDWSEAEEIIEEEIGLDHFENIDEDPIAAASIAQVHKATLETGEDVVIKVKRPGIDEKVEQDLKILEFFTQFSSWALEELDLERVGLNAQIFKENLKEEENLKVPEIYPELNTEKVLVMEYVEGVKCNNTEKLKEMNIDGKDISDAAVKAGLRQSIIDGFFHADTHPSNFLITEDSKIIYLDFGMMGNVSEKTGEKLGLLLLYLINEDIESIIDCLEELGTLEENYSRENIEEIVEEKVLVLKNTSLKQTSITQQMFNLFVDVSKQGLKMPSNMALLGKNLVTMEGIALTIYPDFRIQDSYEDIVKETLKEKNSPDKLAEDFTIDLIKNKELFTKLPTKLNNKLDSNNDREINITQEPQNIETLPAGLIISSGLVFAASPFYPPLAILGFGQLGLGLYLYRQSD